MKQKVVENSKWTRLEKLSLLKFLWLPFVYFLTRVPKIKTELSAIAKILDMKVSTLTILIVSILFVILTLLFLLKKSKNKQLNLPKDNSEKLTKPLEQILVAINKSDQFRIGSTNHNLKYSNEQIRAYLGYLVGNRYVYSAELMILAFEPVAKIYKLNPKGYDYIVSHNLIYHLCFIKTENYP